MDAIIQNMFEINYSQLIQYEILEKLVTFNYQKWDKESDGWFDKVVHVGLPHDGVLSPVDVTWLDQGRVQVQVVGHDHSTDDADSLKRMKQD